MTRRIILWDVDGTLVSCGPAGREALEAGARKAAGLSDVPEVTMGGKTDPRIIEEILLLAGVEPRRIREILPIALREAELALSGWTARIAREGFVQPGVRELLGRLARIENVRQTLVTGNLAHNAEVKVGAFGLDSFFDFEVGAYGTDHSERDRLVPICLGKVRALRSEAYLPEEVWVIGDTHRDLSCARAAGCRCLIVGTGRGGFDAVRHLEADYLFEDLSDTDEVTGLLLEA
jgi:phosphoglycolate phosphatase